MSRCRVDGCTYEGDVEAVTVKFQLEAEGDEFEQEMTFCPDHAPAVRGEVAGSSGLSISWAAVKCETCGGLRPLVPVPYPDGSGGDYTCGGCGAVTGGWLNGGTLDLGLVSDEQLNPRNDFEILPPDIELRPGIESLRRIE